VGVNGVDERKPSAGNVKKSARPEERWAIRKDDKTFHKFFILRPKDGVEIEKVTNELLALNDVLEVYVTEGNAGFMVKARFDGEREPEQVANYIKANIDNRYGTLVSYLNYKR
jgi:hypothetical protein